MGYHPTNRHRRHATLPFSHVSTCASVACNLCCNVDRCCRQCAPESGFSDCDDASRWRCEHSGLQFTRPPLILLRELVSDYSSYKRTISRRREPAQCYSYTQRGTRTGPKGSVGVGSLSRGIPMARLFLGACGRRNRPARTLPHGAGALPFNPALSTDYGMSR